MSTAGKVLTVLILLVMVVWVVVLSGVTQLNLNWEEKIARQDKQLQKLQTDADKAAGDYLRVTEQARLMQDQTERELGDLLARIAAAERRLSSTIEDQTRLKFQVAEYLVSVERAKENKATREAEFAQGETDLAKKKDEIAKAQGVNAELRDQLTKLQNEFKRLLAENASKLEKATKDGSVARPTSSRRTSPAS